MRLNRKWMLVIALVVSMATAISGTLAYLTSTDTATNTFTVGNVSIDLQEPNYPGNTPTLLPGVEIAKDPQIKNTGSTEAWVWMEITVPTDLMSYIDWNTTDWTKTETTSGNNTVVTMKRETKLPAGETTATAFTKVALPSSLTTMPESLVTSGTVDIVVDAYAIQDANFANIDAAIAAYDGEGGEPDTPAANRGDDNSKTYPVPADVVEVANTTDLLSALANGSTNILLKNGEYEWKSNDSSVLNANAARNKTLNLYGESRDGVVIHNVYENGGDAGADYDFEGSTVNFYGLTISTEKNTYGNYEGWPRMTATYNDCVIKDNYTLYGDSVFNYCTLDVSGDKYNIWTWGADNVTFDHCTFNSDGKALLVYNQSCNVKVSNCLFNDNGGLDTTKAAIETGADSINSGVVKYNIEVNDTKVNGYAVNTTNCNEVTTNLWANKNGLDHDHLNVTVDGSDVY